MTSDNTVEQIEEWRRNREHAIISLYKLANELDEVERDVKKAKIAGSATSVAFGIGSAVAGIASFFTFGAAVPVAIAFGVVAGSGGLTTAGSTFVKRHIEKLKLKEVQKLLDDDIKLTEDMKTTFQKLIKAGSCTLSVASKANTAVGLVSVVGKSLVRVVGNVGDDVIVASCRTFATMSRVASIAGPVIGLAIVPFDLYTLVTSAIDVNKKKPSAVADKIRKHAELMQKELKSIWEEECYYDLYSD